MAVKDCQQGKTKWAHHNLIRVITIAKEKNWVKSGDFIVVTYGDTEGVAGSTNSLKIVKVP